MSVDLEYPQVPKPLVGTCPRCGFMLPALGAACMNCARIQADEDSKPVPPPAKKSK